MKTAKKSRFSKPVPTAEQSPGDASKFLADIDYLQVPIETLLPSNYQDQPLKNPSPVLYSQKPLTELMEESLQQGLSKTIDSKNKGFKLLSKFGYKEGDGLGKDGSGIIEPISNIGKRKHKEVAGIGILEQRAKKLKEILNNKEQAIEEFMKISVMKRNYKKLKKDKSKVMKILYELDLDHDEFCHPNVARYHDYVLSKTFGTNLTEGKEEEEEEEHGNHHELEDAYREYHEQMRKEENRVRRENEEITEEKITKVVNDLIELLILLREVHCYCFYCGAKFDDHVDLDDNCPGLLESDH
jgi:hypothetical protein